jgi:hypothetical protein
MNNNAPEKRTKEDQCADVFYGTETEDLRLDSAVWRGLFWLGELNARCARVVAEKFGVN